MEDTGAESAWDIAGIDAVAIAEEDMACAAGGADGCSKGCGRRRRMGFGVQATAGSAGAAEFAGGIGGIPGAFENEDEGGLAFPLPACDGGSSFRRRCGYASGRRRSIGDPRLPTRWSVIKRRLPVPGEGCGYGRSTQSGVAVDV